MNDQFGANVRPYGCWGYYGSPVIVEESSSQMTQNISSNTVVSRCQTADTTSGSSKKRSVNRFLLFSADNELVSL